MILRIDTQLVGRLPRPSDGEEDDVGRRPLVKVFILAPQHQGVELETASSSLPSISIERSTRGGSTSSAPPRPSYVCEDGADTDADGCAAAGTASSVHNKENANFMNIPTRISAAASEAL